MQLVVRWPAEAIWQAVVPYLPGFTVEVLPEIDSSNSELMRRSRAGQSYPTLLVAERQTAGRGRLGRQWHSPPGSSLTFSLGLVLNPADWGGLSLAVGTSLADSLAQATGADLRIKWPNDVWLGGNKLAGVLVETAGAGQATPGRYVVVGVGLNVRQPEPGWAPPASADQVLPAQAPAWLQDAAEMDAPAALLAVAARLVADLQRFEQLGFAAFAQRFAQRDALAGREVLLSDGRRGWASGVSASGALRLDVLGPIDEMISGEVISGEVSVRPVP